MTVREKSGPSGWRWLWVSIAVVAADQATKVLVQMWLSPGEVRQVTGIFSFILTFNTGMAFSILADAGGWQRWFFTLVALAAVALIGWLLQRGGSVLYRFGLALILGGAFGNLCDRIVVGKVVDFLLFHYDRWAFPAFNVADSAITIGAGLIIMDSFRQRHTRRAGHDEAVER